MADLNDLATPTLMRAARGTYAQAIGAELGSLGIDDLPRNGAFILAGVDSAGGPRTELSAELGVTRQAVSQLIDTLVNRGYLERGTDPDDRRRLNLTLTDSGRDVVDAVVRAVDSVDRRLEERVSRSDIDAMRSALIALTEIKTTALASGTGRRPARRGLRQFSPIFPVRDLASGLAHYAALGFRTFAYEDGADYGFAERDRVGLHLLAAPPDRPGPGSAYLYVGDADALYAEWSRAGIAGQTRPVEATEYGLREGSHVDPDGNLIRFGSPIEE